MFRHKRWLAAGLLLVLAGAPGLFAQAGGGIEGAEFLVRGNVALDPFNLGLAFGVGGGYRFPLTAGTSEVMVDLYYSPPIKVNWEDADYTGWESNELLIISARFDWLFLYSPGKSGFFPLIGSGFFTGALWRVGEQTYKLTGNPESYGGDYFASGAVLNVGVAYAFKKRFEARFEIPVLVYFGAYGAVSIPFTASFVYRI